MPAIGTISQERVPALHSGACMTLTHAAVQGSAGGQWSDLR